MNALINRAGSLQSTNLEYFLIDGSGSMMDKWHDTLAGITGYVDVLRSRNIHSWGIAHVFDSHELANIQLDCELKWWPNLAVSPLRMNGFSTPLFDAINYVGRDLRERDPRNASIIIVTDGDENASRHTDAAQARAILDWCRAHGWQVTFLGAEFNNSKQARLLGADESNSIGVQQKKLLDAGKRLGEKRVQNIVHGTDINFTDDEKQQFGGYLAGPSTSE